ncbi:MAG: hypothetical protein IJR53_05935 [Bacteroidales bacterium]|nr:hypothetical protein [Bacteroidales bacterium]
MKRNNRNIVFCILAASLLLCFTSCKKEKETEMVTLKLALEQPTDPSNQKVYLDDQRLVNWYTSYTYNRNIFECVGGAMGPHRVDEKIRIINNNDQENLSYVENYTAEVNSGTTYTAVYPATNSLNEDNVVYSNGRVKVKIPAVQAFVPGPNNVGQNLVDLPMGAFLNTSQSGVPPVLMFRNLGSLIKVTVENPSISYPFRINSIKLSADNVNLCGENTWTFNGASSNNTVPTLASSASGGKEVMLDFNHIYKTIPSGQSETFYIVVAPLNSTCSLRIQVRGAVVGTNGTNSEAIKVHTKTFAASTLDRSRIGTINAKLRTGSAGYTKSGDFSVSASNKVYFSPGNIGWGYSLNASNNVVSTWLIFKNLEGEQYDALGGAYNQGTYGNIAAGRFLDLFDYTLSNQIPSISTYYPYAGANIYTDPGDPNYTWRNPNQTEMKYVLNTRSVSNSLSARYAKGRIRDKNDNSIFHNGLILFPDAYIQPIDVNINNVNDGTKIYSVNSLEYYQWKLMEAAGAIFLPVTGFLQSYSNTNIEEGYYWVIHYDAGREMFNNNLASPGTTRGNWEYGALKIANNEVTVVDDYGQYTDFTLYGWGYTYTPPAFQMALRFVRSSN